MDSNLKKWSKQLNLKYLIKATTLIGGFLLVILCSIANIGLDFKNFNFYKWLSKTILITSINIFGLLMGESISNDTQKDRTNGRYQNSLSLHQESKKRIKDIQNYLPQYLFKVSKEELKNKKISALQQVGCEQAEEILLLTIEELDLIHFKAQKIKGRDYFKINDTQYKVAVDILNGAITIECPNATYFLNNDLKMSNRSFLEEHIRLEREISFNKWAGRIYRIISCLIVSSVWSAFTVQDFINTGSVEAWTNLLSRVFALIISFFGGYSSGVLTVKTLAKIVEYKTTILDFFYNAYYTTKDFIPKSKQELAHEAVIKEENIKYEIAVLEK